MVYKNLVLYIGLLSLYPALVWAQDENSEGAYRTPLAGEALETTFAGEKIQIPPRDRRELLALNVGSSFLTPKIGGNFAVPFAALYYQKYWEDDHRRFRAIVTGLVNYLNFADGTWNDRGWEVLLQWENYTIPFPRAEILNDEKIEDSEIYWGHVLGSIGLGFRVAVPPYHYDNDFRAQLLYEAGYLYIDRSSHTGDDVILPPSTPFHELHLRLRYDAFDRNLLELPHRGWAAGMDLSMGRRDRWSDHQFSPLITFTREDTRDYLRITAYAVAALAIPFVSERHRLLLSAHGGWSKENNWDRFSAFRIGGGPSPSESNDLARHPFPGAVFDQFIAERYLILTMEYRLELTFFFFLHVRGTVGWGRIAGLDNEYYLDVESLFGHAFSAGITSGFFWNSVLYFEYAYDHHVIRRAQDGHAFLVSWGIAF